MIVRGPFELEWGEAPILQVESIELDYNLDTEDYVTVQHQTYEVEGSLKANVNIVLLGNDVESLAVVLPDFHVANGETLSTGETVSDPDGAIDYGGLGCETQTYADLDIRSCANPKQVFRLKNARTRIDSVEFDDKVRKVTVRFVGEPASGEAVFQFFTEGGITPAVS